MGEGGQSREELSVFGVVVRNSRGALYAKIANAGMFLNAYSCQMWSANALSNFVRRLLRITRPICDVAVSLAFSNTEELYFSNAAGIHVSDSLAPLHKGNLNIVIAFNGDKVAIFVTVPELQHTLANAARHESCKFSVNSIDQGLIGDIKCNHERHIVPAITVDPDLQLRGHGQIWTRHGVAGRRERRRTEGWGHVA